MSSLKRPRKNALRSSGFRLHISNAGQGAVEYILLIAVLAMLFLALKQTMFGSMGNFVSSAMGTYVECLLESGELPTLGTTDDNKATSCSIDKISASGGGDSSGSTAGGDVAGKSGANGGGGSDSDSDQDKTADNSKANSAEGGGSGGGGGRSGGRTSGGGRRGGGAGNSFALGQSSLGRGTAGADGGDADGSAGKRLKSEDGGGGSGNGFFGSNRSQVVSRGKFLTGSLGSEEVVQRAKKTQERSQEKVNLPFVEGQTAVTKARTALAAPEKNTRTVADVEMEGLDIGQIIKIMLIAGIIIIFLVLIGGQALSLSKSWEKGE